MSYTGRHDTPQENAKDTWFLVLGTVGVGLALVGGCSIVGLLIERITR